MKNIERDFLNHAYNLNKNGVYPTYVDCLIRFKDDGNTCEVTIKLNNECIDDEDDDIFFYCNGVNDFVSLLANIDELDNYDNQEEDNYQDGVEDFVVIKVFNIY